MFELDELRNSNMPRSDTEISEEFPAAPTDETEISDDPFAGMNEIIDKTFKDLGLDEEDEDEEES